MVTKARPIKRKNKKKVNYVVKSKDVKNIKAQFTTENIRHLKPLDEYTLNNHVQNMVYEAKTRKRNRDTFEWNKIEKQFRGFDLNEETKKKIIVAFNESGVEVIGQNLENDEYFKELQANNPNIDPKHLKVSELNMPFVSSKDRGEDVNKAMMANFGSSKMLKADQELELAKLLGSKNPQEKQYAINQLVTSNMRLVMSVAKKFMNKGIDLEDLLGEGIIGLMRGIEKFEYKRGFKFSTYATYWIRQAISRSVSDYSKNIRVPVHMIEQINRVKKAEKEATQQLGRKPTDEEISRFLGSSAGGYTPKKVSEIKKITFDPISLDKPVGFDEENLFGDFVKDVDIVSPSKFTEQSLVSEYIDTLMQTVLLPEEEQITRMRMGLKPYPAPLTLEEIGKQLGKTKERVRQIEAKALRKLKQPSKNAKLKQFVEDEQD